MIPTEPFIKILAWKYYEPYKRVLQTLNWEAYATKILLPNDVHQ